jgi:hypothetical protein
MDIAAFKTSLQQTAPPARLSLALQALWWDAKGDWEAAHRCAQEQKDEPGAWVHAYLHRKEGDAANANYWYGRAGRPATTTTKAAEWEAIARKLLDSV